MNNDSLSRRLKMHTLVEMLLLSRKEFERNLAGLADEDARKHIKPMNCISWIIAHVAAQHRVFFVEWPLGASPDSRYTAYSYGAPASEPLFDEALHLWKDACTDSMPYLESVTDDSLRIVDPAPFPQKESRGTLLVRCIFHTWCHLGEISSIRQILGHKPPQFVDMHGWTYRSR